VAILLQHGAKGTIADSVGATALHRAVATHNPSLMKDCEQIVSLLIQTKQFHSILLSIYDKSFTH
jgi:hypothetical protein